jgi:hypothetical protein
VNLNWRQAITSAIVAFIPGALIIFVLRGTIDGPSLGVLVTVAIMVGASRLVDIKR